jgi:4-methyl-5(b-hydroxyethyl)-thiazole monophosphate biosynthesis
MTRALIPLADGAEEMEAVIVIDTLRRAGWEVVAAGLRPGPVTASRGVKLLPDADWTDVNPDSFDVLILPGGNGGTTVLSSNSEILRVIRQFAEQGRWVAAVCAGPKVLKAAGILEGRSITSHPSVGEHLREARRKDDPVVVDGRLVTSQGPGTCFQFALTLVALVDGAERARAIAGPMIVDFTPPA